MRYGKTLLMGCAVALLLSLPQCPQAAIPVTDANLRAMLEKILRENPDLVLDVLRQNSETVLDIAQQGSNLRRKHALQQQWQKDMTVPKSVRCEDRPLLGRADAPVRIVAFSDFTCHFCQKASETLSRLMAQYGDKVNLIFKSLPQDKDGPGTTAASYFVALAQQDQAKAWRFYSILFANRDKVITEGNDFIRSAARSVEADMRRLDRDSNSRKVRDIIREDLEDAEKLGVDGTPHFLVNDLVVRGALPDDLFRAAIDTALKPQR